MKRLSLAGVSLLALLIAAPSVASPIIMGLPAQGGTGNSMPFGFAYAGEYQQVYTQTLFSDPITIIGLEFYNTAYDGGASSLTSGNWMISLSTTSADWNTLTAVYGDNLGADNYRRLQRGSGSAVGLRRHPDDPLYDAVSPTIRRTGTC